MIANVQALPCRATTLFLGPDAFWYQISSDGPIIDFSNRRAHRRILRALAVQSDQRELTLEELVAIGWPGERLRRPSARNRLHVTLTFLRNSGLRDLIERTTRGYRLAPHVRVRFMETEITSQAG